ncbi:MAG: GAF domain-containing protein [Rhodanobacteraceae bacterium]|nr:GAF domain-containing protein [Rhodanobacteraceae bacterium]
MAPSFRHSLPRIAANLRRGVAVFAVSVLFQLAAAQVPHPGHLLFQGYGAAQGLPDVGIFQVVQDRTGFIWATTEDGLYRYDSHRFQAFGLRDGLPSVVVTAIHEDASGTLWVGTRAGLARWNGQTFQALASSDGRELDVAAIVDSPDTLWVAAAQGLYRRRADGPLEAVAGWPGGPATAAHFTSAPARLWVARWDSGAQLWTLEKESWRQAILPANRLLERIGGIVADGGGRLWVRQASTLLVGTPGDRAFADAQLPPSFHSRLRAAGSYLVAGRHGDVWVPTDSGVLHYRDGVWDYVDTASSLRVPWVRAVLEDREGSLWIGSVGLHRLRRGGLFRAYTTAEGLNDNVVWSVLRDHDNRLWIGGAGLAELTPAGARTVAGTESHYIRTIVEGADGVLYAAGVPGNVVFTFDTRRHTLQRTELASLASRRIMRLLREPGLLWVATDESGLLQAREGKTLEFARTELPQGDVRESIGDISRDGSGRLWVAGRHGLVVRDDKQWKRFTRHDGLRRDFVAYARPMRDGTLLAGYFDPLGIAQVRYLGDRLVVERHIDPPAADEGLNSLFLIAEDPTGRLWTGSGHGLDVRDAAGAWQHFGIADGLVGEDVNNMAFLAETENIWIGTSAGLARFDVQRYRQLPAPLAPTPTITALRVGQRPLQSADSPIETSAGDSRFYARYAALAYADEDQREYRTRLVGFDADFQIGNEHEARYVGLGPGHYQFEVAARSRGGSWSAPHIVDFYIPPLWWQSVWTRTAGVVCLVAVVLLGLRWRMSVLHRRNRALEECVATRTEELSRSNTALAGEVEIRRAAETALEIANAEERRRTERLTVIARIASLISSNLDRDTLLQRSADAVHEVLDYPNVDIPTVEADSPGVLVVRARGGWHKRAIAGVDRIPLATGIMGAAVRERRVQWVNDTSADPRYVCPPNTPGSKAELAIPIVMGDSVYGVLNVEANHPFDELDVASLGIVADYLAVAVENTRLFEQAQDAAVKKERKRVAYDLHDNITQILSSISMQAQALAHGAGNGSEFACRVARLAELAQIASAEMRAMLDQLRPPHAAMSSVPGNTVARDHSRAPPLPRALHELVQRMVPESVIVEFDFAGYVPQQAQHEEALLRVVQEAVSNALRHSGAGRLRVKGYVSHDYVSVSIVDDGRGLELQTHGHGLGQESMRARMASVGGTLVVGAAQPRGTIVSATMPRSDRRAAH